MRIGYFLSSEESGPRALVELADKSQHSDRVLAPVR